MSEGVVFPTAVVTISYGLDSDGSPVLSSIMENKDGGLVDLITGLGILEMAKMDLIERHLRDSEEEE